MEIQLKQRVIGAVVIFTLLIIFLPILFQDDSEQQYVEQILEPPTSTQKLAQNQPESATPDFMSDSLDNIVLEDNAPKTDINEKVQVGRIQPLVAGGRKTETTQNQPPADATPVVADNDFSDDNLDAKPAPVSKPNPVVTVKRAADSIKEIRTVNKTRTDKQVYAVKLNNYANKTQAITAKQKLLSIGFPAYIAQLDQSYNLYVGPELETKYIKALAKRVAEETEFTPEIVVHNSGWKTE